MQGCESQLCQLAFCFHGLSDVLGRFLNSFQVTSVGHLKDSSSSSTITTTAAAAATTTIVLLLNSSSLNH